MKAQSLELTVLTYNIWFEKRYTEIRFAGLIDILQRLQPTIITFQEMTPDIFIRLFKLLTTAGYHCNYKRVENFRPSNGYGVCLFSLIPIESAEIVPFHKTSMGRYFVRVRLTNGICVVTTHLESMQQAPVRLEQIRQIVDHCKSNAPHIWAMDSNLTDVNGDSWNNTNWIDLFDKVGRPATDMYTYDSIKNNNILNNYRSRLDRIYINYAETACLEFRLEGTKPLKETGSPASDHFGIFVRLRM